MEDKTNNYLNEYQIRIKKAEEFKKKGFEVWNNSIKQSHKINEIKKINNSEFEKIYSICGRIISKREHGQSIFFTIKDDSGIIQCYLKNNEEKIEIFENFKNFFDFGDYIYVEGSLFLTKTNELTIRTNNIIMLSKCLHQIPDFHTGLNDIETKYRKRYLDMLVYDETKEKFIKRSKIIQFIREFLNLNNFLEVETPMLHPIPGGATAKPFITKHNALDTNFYLRIAPELYLKRLVVGGLEKVYEINRNFRNEGLSIRHNPEFTMLEFYMANENYEYAMDFVENLIRNILIKLNNSLNIKYQKNDIDFSKPFLRLNVKECLIKFSNFNENELNEKNINETCKKHNINFENNSYYKKLFLLFEEFSEKKIIEPVFLIDFPIEISPLAKCDSKNKNIASRFELFICGMEISNGFNELNDPFDQSERFKDQVKEKEKGDEEAMHYDSDYINALEYGLPPCAGVGIGIDRLVMIITNSKSIKDVILFPSMKKI